MSEMGTTTSQTCGRCGTAIPGWSMFCPQCGMQSEESKPKTFTPEPALAPRGATPAVGRPLTTSNKSSTWSIICTLLGFVLCVLFLIGSFTNARAARLRGEPAAGVATTIAWVGLGAYLLLLVVGIVLVVAGADTSTGPTFTTETTIDTLTPG